MRMTVEDFLEYSIEESWQKFTLYDVDTGYEVFTGIIDDCPDKYIKAEVCTFDVVDKMSPRLTLNVTLE